jgi:hypothetical protein
MRDVVVVAIIAVFFALCVAYVRWCDAIIGPDPDGLHDADDVGAGDADVVASASPADVTVAP